MCSFGAAPWRFDANHRVARPGGPLAGAPVTASWNPALAPAMLAGGYVLEEEAGAEVLLQDLGIAITARTHR